ncbi:MAG: ABC transporter ATP-binding protein [Clostridia bacterium]|nr:ABC transporter ATP-binding protein [Clostridia bacterium]
MVKVENVSMKFNLGIEKNFSIKQFMVDTLTPSKRKDKKSRKELNEFWALSDVSFEVKQGEVVGLVGNNGAGKSTLLKIVAGVMKPTSGKVEVGGNICPMIELGAGFDSDLTARENVYLNGAVMGYNKQFLESKYDEIVEFSELQDFMEVPVKNFSSGMIARLAFSIATIVDPEILIVDEILSVGDAAFRQKSENKMKSMIGGGTTVLYVSHSANSIKALCDRVVWLDHGRVMMVGEASATCDEYLRSLNLL